MLKFVFTAQLPVMIVAGMLIGACSGQSQPSLTTAGQLAEAGGMLYASSCAKCHGDNGQGITGPVLIGANNTLDKYGTAQGLLDFIDTSMPLDAPASLSPQEYLEVVSFLLVQNNFISSGTALEASNLGNISLT